jgi:hypothetical protein
MDGAVPLQHVLLQVLDQVPSACACRSIDVHAAAIHELERVKRAKQSTASIALLALELHELEDLSLRRSQVLLPGRDGGPRLHPPSSALRRGVEGSACTLKNSSTKRAVFPF